jgi:hypothetical protein
MGVDHGRKPFVLLTVNLSVGIRTNILQTSAQAAAEKATDHKMLWVLL